MVTFNSWSALSSYTGTGATASSVASVSGSETCTDTVKNHFRGRARALGRDRGDYGPGRWPSARSQNATDSIVRTSVDSHVTRAQSTHGQFTHAARARRDRQPSQTSTCCVAIGIGVSLCRSSCQTRLRIRDFCRRKNVAPFATRVWVFRVSWKV